MVVNVEVERGEWSENTILVNKHVSKLNVFDFFINKF